MWNLSSSLSPFLTIMVQIGFVFGALCSSAFHLSDWINPRTLMLAGSFGAGLFNILIVFWPVFGFTLCMRFLTGQYSNFHISFLGACLALVYPPGLKAISTWFRKGRGIALVRDYALCTDLCAGCNGGSFDSWQCVSSFCKWLWRT